MFASLSLALMVSGAQPANQVSFWCQSDDSELEQRALLVVKFAPSDDPWVANAQITIKPLIGFDDPSPKHLENVQAMQMQRDPQVEDGETFLRIASAMGKEPSGLPWRASIQVPSTITPDDPIRATLREGAYPNLTIYTMTCDNPQEAGQ